MTTQLAILLLAASALPGQTAAPKWQEFSIGAAEGRMHVQNSRNGIRAENIPLRRALSRAFGVPENRIAGPDWIADERYAITAIVDDPKDFQPLFQQELATQFHMQSHRETKVMPVYILKASNDSTKLAASTGARGGSGSGDTAGLAGIKMTHTTMTAFAGGLGEATGRPVIDETHLEGNFDFVLNWKSGSTSALQAAVRNQLGLELADERRPVEVLVIDHIEKLLFARQAQ